MTRFHLFGAKPTFDPDTEKPWEDDAHIGTEDVQNSEAAAGRMDAPEEYDREDAFWILEDGKHPDDAEKWGIVQHAPRVEVRRLRIGGR